MKLRNKIYFLGTVIAFLLFCLLISPVQAARPLWIEDAPTCGKGVVCLEAGMEWVEHRNGDRETCQSYVLYVGLTDNVDISMEKPYNILIPCEGERCNGTGDTVVSLKYRFMEETEHQPAMGLKIFADVQDGNEDGTTSDTEYGAILFASKDLGGITMHGNIAYSRAVKSKDEAIGYALALEKPLNDRWTLMGEVGGESSHKESGPTVAQMGVSYAISPKVVLDLGYVRGLNNQAPRSSIGMGVTLEF